MEQKLNTEVMETQKPNEEAGRQEAIKPFATEPFYPHHFIRQVIQALIVFGVLAALATLKPVSMGIPADPTQMPPAVAPEWAFLAAHHVIEISKLIPVVPLLQQSIGVSAVVAGFLVILLVPYIDRREERRPRKRPIAMAVLLFAIVAYVALTFWPRWMEYLL
jgi:menaquinol-cytochrome c reductase cytochrome b/c subunit